MIPLCVDNIVSSHRLLYAYRYFLLIYSLSFTFALPLLFRSVLSNAWTPGKGYFIIKGKFMHGNAFYWPKKLNRFFVCYFCAMSASNKTINIQWKPKEYEVYLYTIKICSVDCLNELSSEFPPLSAQNSITIQGKLGEMKTAWLIVCQQTAL